VEQLPVRFIQVTNVTRVTPHMARITFGGGDLADFTYDEPDQQVKLYFPKPGQAVPRLPEQNADGDFMRWYEAFTAIPEHERPWMRSYTIRAHHPRNITIDIDFVLHGDAGPATRWAQSAKPGDTLGMFGPSSNFARPIPIGASIGAFDWLLLAGDETALPAIGTLIESLPAGARAVAYIEVSDAAEEQRFDTRGEVTVHWVHRGKILARRSDVLVEAVRGAKFPSGSVFAWLAGESGAVRALRRHLVNERGVEKRSIDFAGYWRPKLTQDDAPTEEDVTDAQELMAHAQELMTNAQRPDTSPTFRLRLGVQIPHRAAGDRRTAASHWYWRLKLTGRPPEVLTTPIAPGSPPVRRQSPISSAKTDDEMGYALGLDRPKAERKSGMPS
jgi:NADPH-dependent ferric siderophore reductase